MSALLSSTLVRVLDLNPFSSQRIHCVAQLRCLQWLPWYLTHDIKPPINSSVIPQLYLYYDCLKRSITLIGLEVQIIFRFTWKAPLSFPYLFRTYILPACTQKAPCASASSACELLSHTVPLGPFLISPSHHSSFLMPVSLCLFCESLLSLNFTISFATTFPLPC